MIFLIHNSGAWWYRVDDDTLAICRGVLRIYIKIFIIGEHIEKIINKYNKQRKRM